MAFPANRSRDAGRVRKGAQLLLYATRGAYHNPTAHRGRVFAAATAATDSSPLAEPVTFGDRSFTTGFSLDITALAPLHGGFELEPLVPKLHAFPKKHAWSVYLRRPLVPLDKHDLRLLSRQIATVAADPADHVADYVSAVRHHA